MKINVRTLINHLRKATIGGANNEVVLDGGLSFAVGEKTGSVISFCSNGITDGENEVIGISNIRKFIQTVRYAQRYYFDNSPGIEMDIVGRRVVFKNDGHISNFPLVDPNTISTTIDDSDKLIPEIRMGNAAVVVLEKLVRLRCLGAIKVLPDTECVFVVDSGEAKLVVGNENEHTAGISLGFVGGAAKYVVQVDPVFLCKVLAAVQGDEAVAIEIREGLPLIFSVPNYTLLLKGIEL